MICGKFGLALMVAESKEKARISEPALDTNLNMNISFWFFTTS
jgi:hypothetical protein